MASHIDGTPAIVPSSTIATFPIGSFLENIASRRDGTLLISCMTSGEIFSLDPHSPDPQSTLVKIHDFNTSTDEAIITPNDSKIDSAEEPSPYGSSKQAEAIIESPNTPDIFYTFSGSHGKPGTWSVFSIDLRSFSQSSGPSSIQVSKVADVPTATWLNGGTILPQTKTLLMAESSQGQIISCDLKSGKVEIWLEHERLGKPAGSQSAAWPGINGVRYYKGNVFATVSEQGIMVRAKVDETTGKYVDGTLDVVVEGLTGDDMAFDVEGNGYVATNPSQSVLKFPGLGLGVRKFNGKDDGRLRVVGGADVAETAGPTALAFGRTENDRSSLYITTTGGLVVPVGDGPGLARIVRADVGARGDTLA